jgi:head-tail adaptor
MSSQKWSGIQSYIEIWITAMGEEELSDMHKGDPLVQNNIIVWLSSYRNLKDIKQANWIHIPTQFMKKQREKQ